MAEEKDTDLDVFDQTRAIEAVSEEKEWVPLPHAELLTVEDADELLRWRSANMVAIVGEREAGKTTLVTEIYERFIRGPFAGYRFAGSRTLAGFERRCHLARLESGASAPDTERTSAREGLRFFHLGLTAQEEARRIDLLISERAGESYRQARNEPSRALGFVELAKARTVVFVLDGARLALDLLREEAFSSVRNLVRASAETKALSPQAEIQFVTTKIDLLETEALVHAVDAVTQFEKRMEEAYRDQFARITCWRTAARDPSRKLEPARGVAALLQSWLSPPKPPAYSIAAPVLHDEFDRFLLRGRKQ
jgi:hypothetical protein